MTTRVFVQRPGVQIPINAEWHVEGDQVTVHYLDTGGSTKSMLGADQITGGGDWVEKTA